MTKEESINLIHKSLTNQIEQEEKERFQQWLNENDKNRAFYSEIHAIWELAGKEEQDEILDEEFEQELKKFENTMADSLSKQKQQKQQKTRRRIFLVSGLIGLGISSVLAFSFHAQNTKLLRMQRALIEQSQVSIKAAAVPARFLLRDSLEVILNEFSGVGVTELDSGRSIVLQGEAYFHSLTNIALWVNTGQTKIKGTHFTASYHPGAILTVVPVSGEITVDINRHIRKVGRGSKLVFNERTRQLSIKSNDDLNFNSWYTHKLVFENRMLKEVLPQLEEHYNIRFDVEKKEALKCKLTGTFQEMKLEDMLEAVAFMVKVEFVQMGHNRFTVKGKGKCND